MIRFTGHPFSLSERGRHRESNTNQGDEKMATCKHCGERNADAYTNDGCCWECGQPLYQVKHVAPVAKKTDEEITAEIHAAAAEKAAKIIPLALGMFDQGKNKFEVSEAIRATCKKNGIIFARKFVALMQENDKFAPVLAIMSPAQLDGRF